MSLHIILFHQVSYHHSSSTSPRALSFQWWFILFITTVYVATSWTLTIPPLTMALIWYRFDFALFPSCLQLLYIMNVCWPQPKSRCLFVFLTVPLFPLLIRPCAGDWRRIFSTLVLRLWLCLAQRTMLCCHHISLSWDEAGLVCQNARCFSDRSRGLVRVETTYAVASPRSIPRSA